MVKSGGRVTTKTTPTSTTPFPEAEGEDPVNEEINSEEYQENIEEEPYGEGKAKVTAPKVYGQFSELKHGVSGKVSSYGVVGQEEERRTLRITNFNYSGKGT